MKFLEKYPIVIVIAGVMGASMSSMFVRMSQAPSEVTAAFRLIWTVVLMSPAVLGNREIRQELRQTDRKTVLLSAVSGILLAIHFSTWFESLHQTTVASSTIIVSTEVIWVALGFCLILKGKLSRKAICAIGVTLAGSAVIAWNDSGSGGHLYGDLLALAAAVAVAGYTLLGRIVRVGTSTTVYTYIVYIFCCAGLVLLTVLRGLPLFGFGWSGVICGLLLAVFSTIMGHSLFSWSLKFFSPTFVSAAKLCEPVIATMLAGLLFREIPGFIQTIGAVIILVGVVWYSIIEMNAER